MANSEADICNLALVEVGHTKFISSINDVSNEAIVCRQFYSTFRDALLSKAPWPFAARQANLVALGGTTWAIGTTFALQAQCTYNGRVYISLQAANTGNQPDTAAAWWRQVSRDDWAFVYVRPADCLKITDVALPSTGSTSPAAVLTSAFNSVFLPEFSNQRNLRRDQKPPFTLGNDATLGVLIFTDVQGAVLKYTGKITDVTLFADEFVQALAAGLAVPLATGLRKDAAVAKDVKAFSREEVGEAIANALQEPDPDVEPMPEYLARR